jgi:hypothetical protein
MKTTLWTVDEIRRARPFLDRLAADVGRAMEQVDRAVRRHRYHRAEFERAAAKDAPAFWVDVVRAEADLEAAMDALRTLSAEAEALNAEIAFEDGADLRLAGQAEDGTLVYWTLEPGSLVAEPVFDLEPTPA